MPHAPRKHLLPVEDTLAALDETVTALSKCAVDFSARVDEDDAPCLYQWHKLEKAARALMQARAIENESLAAVSVLSAEKELISRAVALMDCMRVTAGDETGAQGDDGRRVGDGGPEVTLGEDGVDQEQRSQRRHAVG